MVMKRNLHLLRVCQFVFFLIALPIFFIAQTSAQSSTANTTGFITKWKIPAAQQKITIPIDPNQALNYNYSVDWGDGSSDINQTGESSHTYTAAGTYNVTITGDFPAIKFGGNASSDENDALLLAVEQWGNGTWAGMDGAFYGCINLTSVPNANGPIFGANATLYCMFKDCISFDCDLNLWDLTSVRETSFMFEGASKFNGDISSWNVSNVDNMQSMFGNAIVFNGDLSSWNVSNVKLMDNMFNNDEAFNGDIGDWQVGQVSDMYAMFYNARSFNQNIGGWDVGNVTSMKEMFYNASVFDQNLNSWDVSKVTDMSSMFQYAFSFNGNIASWDVSKVEDMNHMFYFASSFNQNIGSWNVSKVSNMQEMFHLAENFDQNIGAWNVAAVKNMYAMFRSTSFNQPLNSWDVSAVTNMSFMFYDDSLFNQSIDSWNVGAVQDMSNMFTNAVAFNQDLNSWDVSMVENMSEMFESASAFNGNISSWNVAKVKTMDFMFHEAKAFNSKIGSWDVRAVTTMNSMFSKDPVFNQDISGWQTNSLSNMGNMFYQATAFNQDISGWNVSKIYGLYEVFFGASAFDQNLGAWNIANVTDMTGILNGTAMSVTNYEATLQGWSKQNVKTGVTFGVQGIRFCNNTGHAALENKNWHFRGDRRICFVPAVPDGQGVVYVDSTVSVPGDGSSWKNALQYLSNATQSANSNAGITEIHIAKGTYFPTGDRGSAYRDSTFNIARSGLKLLGGYPNGGGDRDITANQTLLSGDIGVAGDSTDNVYGIMTISNLTKTDSLIVDGFTFTKGATIVDADADDNDVTQNIAAGLTINGAYANTMISNCTFFENYAYYCPGLAVIGGDLQDYDQNADVSNPQILHCHFINNKVVFSADGSVSYSGVLVNMLSSPLILDCDFIGNQGYLGGSTLNSYFSNPLYYNCRFSENKSVIAPLACNVYLSKPVFLNCLISDNECTNEQQPGSGNTFERFGRDVIMMNLLYSEASLVNCTVANNTGSQPALNNSRLFFNAIESAIYVTNSVLWGNVNSVVIDSLDTKVNSKMSYSLAEGIAADATSHMLDGTGTPAIFTDLVNGDYNLLSISPAVDGGLNDSLNQVLAAYLPGISTGGQDLAGNLRIVNNVVDMGAYELKAGGLPVKVSELSGKINATGQVVLTWNSFTESYNKGFSIQVSSDGITFKEIGFVPSQALNGNSSTALSYNYNAGSITGTKYYRFMQVDQNEHLTSSNIIHLSAPESGFMVQVYPNPVQNQLHVKIKGGRAANSRIFLVSFTGKVLRQIEVTSSEFVIDMQSMAAGIYLLNYKDDHENSIIKVIKK